MLRLTDEGKEGSSGSFCLQALHAFRSPHFRDLTVLDLVVRGMCGAGLNEREGELERGLNGLFLMESERVSEFRICEQTGLV